MQFPADDEESDFSLNAGRSRLSSLFQSENTVENVNQALTFQAPKQPKKHDNSQTSTGGPFKLIHASAVHAYKNQDGGYVNQGKLGIAILGIHENESYRLLLYKGKQVQVASTSIVPSFNFVVQPRLFINFYDDKSENWCINLDSETALIDLAKQVALAKANCESKNRTTLILQVLVPGDEKESALEIGDAAEIRYTGWLLTNYSFGQEFDSNMKAESAFRFRLGKSKVIKAWTDGLVGAKQGSARLLIVPPSLGYGSEGLHSSVPPNSTLIFEIHVIKVKKSRESSHSPSPSKLPETMTERKPEVPHRQSISSQDDNIKMRGASISEQLSQSPKKDKAQLISRMAKMGTATLPLPGAVVAHVSSDSENEEEETLVESSQAEATDTRTSSPKPLSKPNTRSSSVSSNVVPLNEHPNVQDRIPLQVTQQTSQISMFTQSTPQAYMPQPSAFPYQPQMGSPFHVPQGQFQMMPATSMADTHLPLLLSETRTQNTEVRMGLYKIADKVDTVMQKVDDLRLQQGRGVGQAAFMDSTLILHNIERIVQENKTLKEDVDTKSSKIQSLNEKVCDLLQRNQRFFEENISKGDQKSDISSQAQAMLSSLKEQKEKLTNNLQDTSSKLEYTETRLYKCEGELAELKQRLLDNVQATGDSNDSVSENDSLVIFLQEQVHRMKEEKASLTGMLAEQEKQCKELIESNTALKQLIDKSQHTMEETNKMSSTLLTDLKGSYEKQIAEYEERLKSAKIDIDRNTSTNATEISLLKKEKMALAEDKEKLLLQIQERDKKYEVFYSKTRSMKEQYEKQISELVTEVKRLPATNSGTADFSGEIKKVMNTLYKLLQGKFETNTSYEGSKVLEMSLEAIRALTFQMLQMKGRAASKASETTPQSDKVSDSEQSSPKSTATENSTLNEKTPTASDPETAHPGLQQNGVETDSSNSGTTEDQIVSSVEGSSVRHTNEVESKSEEETKNSVSNTTTAGHEGSAVLNSEHTEDNADSSQLQQSESKVVKTDEPEKRISPEHLSSHNPLDAVTGGSKMWKPQPPPLFDDDDEDDEDDWLA